MLLRSFFRFFKRQRQQPITRQPLRKRRPLLDVERLEARELLSVIPPKILSVTPPDGSVVGSTLPTVAVTYSTDVTGAAVAGNYELFDSSGNKVSVDSVTYGPGAASGTFVATLHYNSGNPLTVDRYTLFVNANNLVGSATSTDPGVPIAQPGQLVVANAGEDTISTINLPGTGTLGAASNIPLPSGAPPNTASPTMVQFGDFTGDGVQDMAVLDAGLGAIDIFAGRPNGGFAFTPTLELTLTKGSGAKAFVVADLNGDGFPDIAVANTNLNTVSVFLNVTAPGGTLTFTPPLTSTDTFGAKPVGITVGNFLGTGLAELAIVNSTATVNTSGGGSNQFTVVVYTNSGTGTFNNGTPIVVGDVSPTGLQNPTWLVAANLNGSFPTDMAVSGSNGVSFLFNSTNGTTPSFNVALSAVGAMNGVTNGILRPVPLGFQAADDIVATGPTQTVVFINTNNAGLMQPLTPLAIGSPAAPAVGAFTSSGFHDVALIKNGTNGAEVLRNLSTTGSVVAAVGSGSAPIVVTTTTAHGLQPGDQVWLEGITGFAAANGVFTVVGTPSNTSFTINNNTAGAGTGGTWDGLFFAAGGGTVTGATNVAGQPITITSRHHGLVSGQQVTVSNVLGNTGANGTFFVNVIDGDHFQLLGSTPTGAYSPGTGKWALVPASVDTKPVGLAAQDVNGDGNLDVVTVNQATTPDVTLLYGNGDGTLGSARVLATPTGAAPDAVAVGDLNGDGVPDLVVADSGTSQVSVYLGKPGGGYAPPVLYSTLDPVTKLGATPVSVMLADLTNTGKLDIIVASQTDNVITILANNGSGVFSFVKTISVGAHPTQVVAGKFTTDGNVDLVIAHSASEVVGATTIPSGATLLLGNGNRTFQAAKEIAPGIKASAVGVADFNRDGNQDIVLADNEVTGGSVVLLLGDGTGNFASAGAFAVGIDPVALTIADLNNDSFPDVVTVSGNGTTNDNVSVLLNAAGQGFNPEIANTINAPGALTLQGVTAAYVDNSAFLDLVITTADTVGSPNNVITLNGLGNGSFNNPQFYLGASSAANPGPSFVTVVSDPFIRITNFKTGGSIVSDNLIANANFSTPSLSGIQGSLDGWQTANLTSSPGSNGLFMIQSGFSSPLSGAPVPPPPGNAQFQAMLDESDQPLSGWRPNPNTNAMYQGTHALYQDLTIPAGAVRITVTFTLYIDDSNSISGYSDTNSNPLLDFHTAAANQQVRVDLLDPASLPFATNPDAPGTPGVLDNLFITKPTQTSIQTVNYSSDINVSKYAGRSVRLRFGTTNNQGKILVGVSGVSLRAIFPDSQSPKLTGVIIRNPNALASPSLVDPSTDPTIVGNVSEIGSINNISFIEFDTPASFRSGAHVFRLTNWDASGNFSFTLPTNVLLPGLNTITISAVDKVGNATSIPFSFTVQGPSNVNWASQGPDAISTTNQPVTFSSVAGDVTSVVTDPRDLTGNTIYISSDNGGVWKSTDGGASWNALTDTVTDQQGNPVPENVGGLGLGYVPGSVVGPDTWLYAATGAAELSVSAHPGEGVLVSKDGGHTWTLTGQSVLSGAFVNKVQVSLTNPQVAYVSVSYWQDPTQQPAIFRTTDGGTTWVNVLNPANMFTDRNQTNALGAGTPLASVTDLVMDPFNPLRLFAGLGNIGKVPASTTAGVWLSADGGNSWVLQVGGDNPRIPNDTIPTGTSVGRVTVALGVGNLSEERYVYVLMSSPPGNPNPSLTDEGELLGLFKSSDNMLDFTKVMLKENEPLINQPQNFVNINVLGHEGSNVGALAVDVNNPNVVYVGGSSNYEFNFAGTIVPNHGLIRVDTGNMRDTNWADPFKLVNGLPFIPNDGDDIDKATTAENPKFFNMNNPRLVRQYYDPGPPAITDNYTGEGVYWYDLQFGTLNDTFGPDFSAPPPLTVATGFNGMMFDSQGRLLIATESGLYRGTTLGLSGYDYTSNGLGLLGGDGASQFDPLYPLPPSPPGMQINAINGNLQIADVTGAGLDPSTGKLYTSQVYSGTATSGSGPLGWTSSGLTRIDPSGSLDATPSATSLLVAAPDPSRPGQSSNVYTVYEQAYTQSYVPQTSTDGGVTFNDVTAAGISINDIAGPAPAFAIDPTKQIVNGVPEDLLLLGTQKVYLTGTSTNVWDAISPNLTTGFLSAAAFAPNNAGYYYVGSTLGEVFVLTPGATSWANVSNGLPGSPGSVGAPTVEGITVSPTDPNTFFVMLSGTGTGFSHVWKTTDGGTNWVAVNITAGNALLPDVAAYSLVIDPTPGQGAPLGRYYLGTGVGVYVSYSQGLAWQPFGQGLPHAPVVQLQFDENSQTLVAAVQGRGAYTLSTRLSGPAITSITPATPQNQPLTQVSVTFNEGVDPRTFTVGADAAARTSLSSVLVGSQEFFFDQVVGLYQQYLRRTPGPAENISWATTLYQQSSYQAVVVALVSSTEYFQNPALGNNSNATWINQVYEDLFFRSAVGDGTAAQFLANLNAGTETRAQVAGVLVQSVEYLLDLAAMLYNRYLGRNKPLPAVSDPEISATVQAFLAGATVPQTIANLLGSQEFYNSSTGFYRVGSAPSAMAVADLNGAVDSHGTPINDLIVALPASNMIAIYQGQVGGGYAATPTLTLPLPSGASPTAIVAADFNGDGLPDIAVLNSGTKNVIVFLNTTGALGAPISFDGGTTIDLSTDPDVSGPIALVAGDFNNMTVGAGQPALDLAFVSSKPVGGKYFLTILPGNGDGTFTAAPVNVDTGFGITTPPTALAFGDLNGDGLSDFVVTASSGGAAPLGGVNVLTSNGGNLTYNAPVSLSSLAATAVTVGNIDTSGKPSVVVGTAGGNLLIFQTLTSAPLTLQAGGTPVAIALDHASASGLNDIVVLNGGAAGNLTTFHNTTTSTPGTITFNSPITYPVAGINPIALALADTDQNLVADAVIASAGSGSVSVLPGTNRGFFQTPTDSSWLNASYVKLFQRTVDLLAVIADLTYLAGAEQSRLGLGADATVPLSITDQNPGTDTIYVLTFAPQPNDGTFSLTVGPNTVGQQIKDLIDINGTYQTIGHAMNQNGNLVNGEDPADRFNAVLGVNTSDDGQFVSGLYHALLGSDPNGRAADAAGFAAFLAPIDAARSQALAIASAGFTTSAEYRGNLIIGYYNTYLRRAPGSADVQAWTQLIAGGQISEEGIIAAMVGSPEYFQTQGSSANDIWLNRAYLDLLGRTDAGDTGAALLLANLNAGTLSRAQIAFGLVSSPEFLDRVIYGDFQHLLGRAPVNSADPGQNEYQRWLPLLMRNQLAAGVPTPDEQFIENLTTSGEYFARAGNTNTAWAASMYLNVIGRSSIDPSGAEVGGWANFILGQYAPIRQAVALSIVSSPEHRGRVVAGYYQTYLGRAASPLEIQAWVQLIQTGLTDQQVLAAITSSPEFFPTSGAGSSNSGWVAKFYSKVLLRSSVGDPAATSFINFLNTIPTPQIQQARNNIALAILAGPEYLSDLVASFYNKYLGRNKFIPANQNDPELMGWVALLQKGITQEQVIAAIVSSAEFFLAPHTVP
jgi:hypothetical protein